MYGLMNLRLLPGNGGGGGIKITASARSCGGSRNELASPLTRTLEQRRNPLMIQRG